MKNLISLLSIIILSANLIFAQIINIPADYPTIQEGIDAANYADTILVAPGTYYENIVISDKFITLASWYLTTQDTSYISQTVIDGESSGGVIAAISLGNNQNYQIIQGFTITNGYANKGGGINISWSYLELKNLIIKNNYASTGGGICIVQSSTRMSDVKIIGNSASGNGGGIYSNYAGLGQKERSICQWLNITISNNSAYNGGGIYRTMWASIKMCNGIINNNNAEISGGGIFSKWEGVVKLTNVKIIGNSAGEIGGGICGLSSFDGIYLENAEVVGNSANDGGGVYIFGTLTICKNVLLADNNAINRGGGLWNNGYLFINNVTMAENVAEEGNGIFCWNASLYLQNFIIFSFPSQQIVCSPEGDSSTITISNSLIMGGESFIQTNENATVNWLEGNINQNPVFVNSGDYPYQINDNSPCVDAGSTDTTGITEFDLAGEPRFFNGRIDMGAYEWNTFVGLEEPVLSSSNWDINIFPNPFTTTTTFEYTLPQTSSVQITIFNHLSEEVEIIRQKQSEGKQQIVWNAEGLPPGVYFYRIKTAKEFASGKMLLLK